MIPIWVIHLIESAQLLHIGLEESDRIGNHLIVQREGSCVAEAGQDKEKGDSHFEAQDIRINQMQPFQILPILPSFFVVGGCNDNKVK